MNPAIIAALISMGQSLIDKFFPDKEKQAAERTAAAEKMQELVMQAQAQIESALAQSDAAQDTTNSDEAKGGWFGADWRPLVGYICALGLFWQFFIQPLFSWLSAMFHIPAPPVLQLQDLTSILIGMLGLSAYHSVEKIKGVS